MIILRCKRLTANTNNPMATTALRKKLSRAFHLMLQLLGCIGALFLFPVEAGESCSMDLFMAISLITQSYNKKIYDITPLCVTKTGKIMNAAFHFHYIFVLMNIGKKKIRP
jgi:hypothetical protein